MQFWLLFNITALHFAVINQNVDIVKLLLKAKNIDINIKDDVFYFFIWTKWKFIIFMIFLYNLCKKPIDYASTDEIRQLLNPWLIKK